MVDMKKINLKSLPRITGEIMLDGYLNYRGHWIHSKYRHTKMIYDSHLPPERNTVSNYWFTEWPVTSDAYTHDFEEFMKMYKNFNSNAECYLYTELTQRDMYEYLLLKRYGKNAREIFFLAWYQPELMNVEIKRYRRLDGESVE